MVMRVWSDWWLHFALGYSTFLSSVRFISRILCSSVCALTLLRCRDWGKSLFYYMRFNSLSCRSLKGDTKSQLHTRTRHTHHAQDEPHTFPWHPIIKLSSCQGFETSHRCLLDWWYFKHDVASMSGYPGHHAFLNSARAKSLKKYQSVSTWYVLRCGSDSTLFVIWWWNMFLFLKTSAGRHLTKYSTLRRLHEGIPVRELQTLLRCTASSHGP